MKKTKHTCTKHTPAELMKIVMKGEPCLERILRVWHPGKDCKFCAWSTQTAGVVVVKDGEKGEKD